MLCAPRPRKPSGSTVAVSPQTSGKSPGLCRRARRGRRCDGNQRSLTARSPVKTDSSQQDPNAELHSFEPLRICLALGALLLGLLVNIY